MLQSDILGSPPRDPARLLAGIKQKQYRAIETNATSEP